jgi:WD40 repeat protein
MITSLKSVRIMGLAMGRSQHLAFAGGMPGRQGIGGFLWFEESSLQNPEILMTECDDDVLYRCATLNDESGMVAAGESGTVYEIHRHGMAIEFQAVLHHSSGTILGFAYEKNLNILAIGGRDGVLSIYHQGADRFQWNKLISVSDHTEAITSIAIDRNQKAIYSGSRDGKVRLHNLSGRLIRTWSGIGKIRNSLEDQMRNSSVLHIGLQKFEDHHRIVCSTSCGVLVELQSDQSIWQRFPVESTDPIYKFILSDEGAKTLRFQNNQVEWSQHPWLPTE